MHPFHLVYRAGTTAAFALASLPGVRHLIARTLRPADPVLALEAGEELVSRPRRVLAITCHPDDLEFFAGGTLHRLARAGSDITAAVLTDGEKGGNRPDLGGVRRAEMEECARILGYRQVRFLGLTDYGLPEDPRLEPVLTALWDEARPEVVFAFDPMELVPGMANRDHKALGRAVGDLARRHVLDGTRVYFYGTRHPNVVVDIEPALDAKIRAVLAHQSQHIYLPESLYDNLVRYYAHVSGAGICRHGESLYRLL